jgi:hypothetical protein
MGLRELALDETIGGGPVLGVARGRLVQVLVPFAGGLGSAAALVDVVGECNRCAAERQDVASAMVVLVMIELVIVISSCSFGLR